MVDGCLFIGLHEFPNVAQSTLDEMAVVRDSLARHHHGIERDGIADEDVLGPIREEEIGGPVGEWIVVKRKLRPGSSLILVLTFCERRKIIETSAV